ncbi:MAG TPA: methyltransferase domain-containing protein [Acidimicrobiales bacterium]|nr:methyltransferase domain-containing protein [Acidimicrobiales bacterium]
MDRPTVEAYERGADGYARQRRAYAPERAEAFAAAVPAGAWRLDVGAGPGHYLPHLGRPVVASDPAAAMVATARERHGGDGVVGVVCEVEALPFRRAAFGGAWASKSLQHVPAARLPLALAELHRVMPVGGVLDVTLFGGEGTDVSDADDDFPGRLFTWWEPSRLADLLVGAGFEAIDADVPPEEHPHGRFAVTARRARSLADTVGAGMRLLVCGLNPSIYAADAGVGFARPGNRYWPAALAAGIVSVDRDPRAALRDHGVGMTDIVKRATARADELAAAEYRDGLRRVEHLVEWLQPGAVCFVGLAGWRSVVDRKAQPGVQPSDLGGRPVYVMPSTSGLNARTPPSELAAHLRAAATLGDQ